MSEEPAEKDTTAVVSEVVKPRSAAAMKKSSGKASIKVSSSPLRYDDKHVPHYLRASTGSCHDFCKYGIKDVHEHRKLNPTFRRSLMNKEKPNEERMQVMDTNPRESRKKIDKKQGKAETVQPLEKPTLVSPIQLMKESDQDSSSLNINTPSQMTISSFDHSSINQAEEPSKDITFMNSMNDLSEGLISKPAHSILDCEEDTAETQGDGCSWVPLNGNFTVTLPVEQSIATSGHIAPSKESSESQVSAELTTKSSIKEKLPNDPHTEVSGVKASSKKLVDGKPKILKASAVEPMSVKLKNNKNTASLKGSSVNRADKTSNESPRIKLKTPCSTHISTPSNVKTPTIRIEGSSGEQCQEKRLTTNYKTTREVNMLKVANKEIGVSNKAKAITQEKKVIAGGPSSIEKSVNEKKTTKRAKLDSGQKSRSLDNAVVTEAPRFTIQKTALPPKKTDASVTPRVIKNQTLISLKTTDASIKPVTSTKQKKLVVNSTPSRGLNGLKNKMKIIGNEDKQTISVPQFSKSLLSKVPSFKLSKHGNVAPATVKNQTKVGNFGPKEKSSYIADKKTEKIDLKAARQKLRKFRSHSFDRNDGHENSLSKWHRVKKYVFRKEVIERNFSIVIKGEIKKRHRRTASIQSLDKPLTPRMLTFSRGKVINPEPRNNNPVKLKFRRQTRMLTSSQSRQSLFASTSSDPNSPKPEAQTVVLRHQDLQDKKEARGLFNNVIEETASKLVETKKSKVKALVGAFETVISLQESVSPVVAIP